MQTHSLKTALIVPILYLAVSHVHALEININPDPDFNNSLAVDAFQRAADTWEGYFSDNITVNIEASFASFGSELSNVIGGTTNLAGNFDYDVIVAQLKSDADLDDSILAYLPSSAQFSANSSAADTVLTNGVRVNKANLKALGFTGVDDFFGNTSDGSISFNSDFNFDFDNSDGITGGFMDFESVALHEIGHLLGFTSTVDAFDQADGAAYASVLDLFRFNADDIPVTPTEFTTTKRELNPGVASVFSDSDTVIQLSTGVNHGDGRQASHFKDNLGLGIMDPTFAFGELGQITDNDLLVFDLIGYDRVASVQIAAVPEPSSTAFVILGALSFLGRRKRTS